MHTLTQDDKVGIQRSTPSLVNVKVKVVVNWPGSLMTLNSATACHGETWGFVTAGTGNKSFFSRGRGSTRAEKGRGDEDSR